MGFRWRLALAVGLFVAGAAGKNILASYVADLRTKETGRIERKLADFPKTIGEWTGTDVPANPIMLQDIKSDDHVNRVYTHPSGERAVLWFNYSGRSLDQYHYPTVCMEGAGWQEDESQRKTVAFPGLTPPRPDAPKPSYCSMYFSRNQEREYVLYWYYLIGEDPIDRTMRSASRYARVFLRGRQNPSLTVEVFSQSANPDPKRLDEFAALVAKELEHWTPPGTETCCELGATY